jgi:hypothetical protein
MPLNMKWPRSRTSWNTRAIPMLKVSDHSGNSDQSRSLCLLGIQLALLENSTKPRRSQKSSGRIRSALRARTLMFRAGCRGSPESLVVSYVFSAPEGASSRTASSIQRGCRGISQSDEFSLRKVGGCQGSSRIWVDDGQHFAAANSSNRQTVTFYADHSVLFVEDFAPVIFHHCIRCPPPCKDAYEITPVDLRAIFNSHYGV